MNMRIAAAIRRAASEWFLIGTVTTLVLLFILFRLA
jgi:hypothetical protein